MESDIKNIKNDKQLEIFNNEYHKHTELIQKLSERLKKRRYFSSSRKFESDIEYHSYPDVFSSNLSGLLEEFLLCLKEIEKNPIYELNSNYYHNFFPKENKCKLDFVGVLVAFRFRINYSLNLMPWLFPFPINSKLKSLENFFKGNLKKSFENLGLDIKVKDDSEFDFSLNSYLCNKELYILNLNTFIKFLKQNNL